MTNQLNNEKITIIKNALRLEIAVLKHDLNEGVYTGLNRKFLLNIQTELIEKDRVLKLLNSGIQNSETNRLLRLCGSTAI
ncbi:hypothetical protein AAIP36_001881 [Flavobacterium psychrophilum]